MKDEKTLFAIEELLLSFADEQEEMTRSDFQARASIVAREIIKIIEDKM